MILFTSFFWYTYMKKEVVMTMEFLYFPDDKSEYIPGIIILLLFVIAAIVIIYFILKISRKEDKKVDGKYIINRNKHKTDNHDEYAIVESCYYPRKAFFIFV